MAMTREQNEGSSPNEQTVSPSTHSSDMKAKRRRLIKGGLSSAPFLITLASKPVLATTCYSPSETLSGAISHKGPDTILCSGRSPGVWRELAEGNAQAKLSWPILPSAAFHGTFNSGPQASFFKNVNGQIQSLTMLEVMQLTGGGDPSKIGFHVIGAYLNILSGLISPLALTTPKLIQMWNEWVATGYFTPYAGAAKWNADQIVSYLKSTGIAP